jgi:hypothetical protein
MSTLHLTVDPVTGARKAVQPPGLPIDENFTSTGQTVFQLATNITDSDNIKCFIDGRLEREGETYAWTRDSETNRITTTESVPAGRWVLVTIFKG